MVDYDLIAKCFASKDPMLIEAAEYLLDREKRWKLREDLDEALKDLTRL